MSEGIAACMFCYPEMSPVVSVRKDTDGWYFCTCRRCGWEGKYSDMIAQTKKESPWKYDSPEA